MVTTDPTTNQHVATKIYVDTVNVTQNTNITALQNYNTTQDVTISSKLQSLAQTGGNIIISGTATNPIINTSQNLQIASIPTFANSISTNLPTIPTHNTNKTYVDGFFPTTGLNYTAFTMDMCQNINSTTTGVQLPISWTLNNFVFHSITKNIAICYINMVGYGNANSGGGSNACIRFSSGILPFNTGSNIQFQHISLTGCSNGKLIRYGYIDYNASATGRLYSPNTIPLFSDINTGTLVETPMICTDFNLKNFKIFGSFIVNTSTIM